MTPGDPQSAPDDVSAPRARGSARPVGAVAPPAPVGRASVPGSVAVPRRAKGRAAVRVPDAVEGRPGQELAGNLAQQRQQELPTTKQTRRAHDQRRRVMPLWQEIPLLIIVSFCVAVLVRSFLIQAFLIPSESMEDTLLIGDRVLVNKIVYETREPARGDVVVFRGTDRWVPEVLSSPSTGLLQRIGETLGDLVGVTKPGEKDFIKRVIAVGGDVVSCCDDAGRVMVNGVGIDEPYLKSNNPLDAPISDGTTCGPRRFAPVTVPAGEVFLMGDNRGVSRDSRCQGPVPIGNIVGRAFFVVWPVSHWAGVDTPDTFNAVPATALDQTGPTDPLPDPITALFAVALLWPVRSRWHPPRTLRQVLSATRSGRTPWTGPEGRQGPAAETYGRQARTEPGGEQA